jgi:hypothetical protein
MSRRYFTARYRSLCSSCKALIEPPDKAFYAFDDSNMVIGDICCGSLSDTDLIELLPNRNGPESTPDVDRDIDPATVMPRGRTARDMCLRCFQIPSSNGDCGCDA